MNIRLVRKINPLLTSKKCQVIYNMVDLATCIPSEDYVPRNDGKFLIVVVASHQYQKNLDGLIEAVNLLDRDERHSTVIKWYGDEYDSSKEKALEKIRRYKLTSVFRFYPATLSIADEMQHADAIGLFSFYEGLSNAICEGMACGKPIICSNVSDLPLILSQSQELLVNPEEPLSIKEGITALLKLDRKVLEHIGRENRVLAEDLFDRERFVNKYIDLLET